LWHSAGVLETLAFALGLVVGSFLNVCIVRIPRGESVVAPGSRCPRCRTPIGWRDNIPLVSWLLLGGRCRVAACRAPISVQYPLVEGLTGALFYFCVAEFGLAWVAAKWALFFSLLVVHIVTDLRERFLSFKLNALGFALGLAFSLFTMPDVSLTAWLFRRLAGMQPPQAVLGVAEALLGALLGGGLLSLVAQGYLRITGRAGMGLGDVYLMTMIGVFLGIKGTFLTILAGSLLGSIIGLGWVMALYATGWRRSVAERAHRRGLGSVPALRFALARRFPLPFGTYLGIAAVLAVFFAARAEAWYDWYGEVLRSHR
jgi:leader peptidase (prepilin peptidase)/N-methyltransferase